MAQFRQWMHENQQVGVVPQQPTTQYRPPQDSEDATTQILPTKNFRGDQTQSGGGPPITAPETPVQKTLQQAYELIGTVAQQTRQGQFNQGDPNQQTYQQYMTQAQRNMQQAMDYIGRCRALLPRPGMPTSMP